MNRRFVFWILLANLAALLTLTLIYPHLMIAPGPLMEGHRELTTDCWACHSPWRGSRPERCIACHEPREIGRTDTKGQRITDARVKAPFHQDLLEQDCVACHSDHRGVMPYRTIRTFSHGLLAQSVQEGCGNCHARPEDKLHRGIKGECGQCHSREQWRPATFDHDPYFRFDRHHETECATCHPRHDYPQYTCYGCHEHTPGKIRQEHIEEGISNYENCVECHRSGDEHDIRYEGRGNSGKRKDDHRQMRRKHDDDD